MPVSIEIEDDSAVIRSYDDLAISSGVSVYSVALASFDGGSDLDFFESVSRIAVTFSNGAGPRDLAIGNLDQNPISPGFIQTNGEAIPEPSTLGLLFTALCVAGVFRTVRRRTRLRSG